MNDSRRRVPRTTGTDRLAFVVLAALAALAIRHHEPYLLGLVALLGFVLLTIARWAERSRTGALVHKLGSPYVAVAGTFELLGPLLDRATTARWDARLEALDSRLFGGLVAAWQGALGRPAWLTDVMSVAYVSFYLLPMVVGVGIYLRSPREFDRYALTTEAGFFVPYVGYFAFPATGPREAFAEGAAIGGSDVGQAARAFVRAAELNVLDAFPSGHTSVVLVVLAFGWRLLPKWRLPLATVVASIVFSTVYLSYHYVVDLIAGALVAAFVLLLAPLAHALGVGARHRLQSPSIDIRSG
ncbi:MAG TPA: phosphatase PAP2 family protein [Polyangiaceae bacterium]|nr:phosphatase PAP2 family protein [Polyangiaceae bacterium]